MTYIFQAKECSVVDGCGASGEHQEGEEVGKATDDNHHSKLLLGSLSIAYVIVRQLLLHW